MAVTLKSLGLVEFGKYKGKDPLHVVRDDPDYCKLIISNYNQRLVYIHLYFMNPTDKKLPADFDVLQTHNFLTLAQPFVAIAAPLLKLPCYGTHSHVPKSPSSLMLS